MIILYYDYMICKMCERGRQHLIVGLALKYKDKKKKKMMYVVNYLYWRREEHSYIILIFLIDVRLYDKYPLRIILSFMCIHYNFTEKTRHFCCTSDYILTK